MPMLRYWYCQCLDDHNCYSIVAKTKKEANRIRDERGPERYDPPELRVVYYKDDFDLMELFTGESGGRGFGKESEREYR